VNSVTYDILTQRIKQLGNLPAMPSVLATLCEALSQRACKVDFEHVVANISFDKSLTAQCLRLANSALFRQRGEVATVREAVLALGLWRIRDLAFCCSLPLMFASFRSPIPKETFWRHALGTAVLAQQLAMELCPKTHQQAYLAGLLHDIGILINAILFPEDYRDVLEQAIRNKSLIEAEELSILGFTHAECGRILAELWRLPVEISDAIEFHTRPGLQHTPSSDALLVQIADNFCWRHGLGYGYALEMNNLEQIADLWSALGKYIPKARNYSEERYGALLEAGMAKALALADHVFAPTLAAT
jgi:HD-like signal output (HDOD) protein